jgi:hypothetical protein
MHVLFKYIYIKKRQKDRIINSIKRNQINHTENKFEDTAANCQVLTAKVALLLLSNLFISENKET